MNSASLRSESDSISKEATPDSHNNGHVQFRVLKHNIVLRAQPSPLQGEFIQPQPLHEDIIQDLPLHDGIVIAHHFTDIVLQTSLLHDIVFQS